MRLPRIGIVAVMIILMLTTVIARPLEARVLTIKIGSIAPLRSPWIKELKKLGQEWKRVSNGEVRMKIYAGSIAGGEEDMIRKIRMGVLGGAVFSNRGMTSIYPDIYVLSIPFSIHDNTELDYIMSQMKETFSKEVEKRRFKVLAWSKAGWIHFFSKKKVVVPDDLKKHKLSFTTGLPAMEQAWKQAGVQVVPIEMKDIMMGLQSGMVDSYYLPPVMAASGQYFALTPHMCNLKVAPLVGGFVISDKIWKRIPEKYRAQIMEVTNKMAKRLDAESAKLEKEAITEMKKHKLVVNDVTPADLTLWKEMSDQGMNVLKGKAFSTEIYNTFNGHIEEYRKNVKTNK